MDQYQVYEKIGEGRASTVYKGRKRMTIDYVAVKKCPKSEKQCLMWKVKCLHLLSHPSVVQFHGWYETRNHLWVLLEYCAGGNLEQLVVQEQRLPEETVCNFGKQIAMALMHLHSHNLLYMDLDPRTIVLNSNGEPKLAGFGAAQRMGHKRRNAVEALQNSCLYFPPAPEALQHKIKTASIAMDAWTLGCLLHFMAVGKKPELKARFSLDRSPLKCLRKDLADIITHLLAKTPKKRMTIQELANQPSFNLS